MDSQVELLFKAGLDGLHASGRGGLSSWDKRLKELEEPKDLGVPYWMRSSAIIEFDISRFVLVFSYWMTFGISAICSAYDACCDVKRKFKSALG